MQTKVWQRLLRLRNAVRARNEAASMVVFSVMGGEDIQFDRRPDGPGPWIYLTLDPARQPSARPEDAVCHLHGVLDLTWDKVGALPPEVLDFLDRYLPYCLMPVFARRQGRPVTVAHFAQSLDGRIATRSGHSRWIGNDANLEHAHRMRALCDGILIGKNTLQLDRPQLTVRRVEGPDPVRIVLGSRIDDCSSLIRANDSGTILVIQKEATDLPEEQVVQILHPCEDYIPCEVVLGALFKKDLFSVLIEGGAKTTSAFLGAGQLDVLQLHIAPILIGSGRSSIQLPEILRIDHAVEFDHYQFHRIANTYMFSGWLRGDRGAQATPS